MIAALVAAALITGPPTEAHPIVVGETRISRGHLRRWADIAQRAGNGGDRQVARQQAAGMIISFHWISGEAAEHGVAVTDDEVLAEFRKLRDESFPRRRDFRAFLRDSGQRKRDLLFRVRVDLLSNRLREFATAGATTPEEQQQRLDEFVQAFRAKWRPRTACRAPWGEDASCGTRSPGRTRRSPSRGRRTSSWGGGDGSDPIPSTASFRPIAPAS